MADRSWAFVLFPLLVSVRTSTLAIVACLLLLAVLSLVGRPLPIEDRRAQLLPLALLTVAGVTTLARGAPPFFMVTLLATVAIVAMAGQRATADVAVRSLVSGIALYLLANIAGWVVGIESPAARVRVALYEQEGAIFNERVLFPFTQSINEPAVLAAALIGYVFISWRRGVPVTRLQSAGCVAGAFVIVASGTRFPVIVLLVMLPAVLLFPRIARVVPLVALGSMFLPFILGWAAPLVVWASGLLEAVPFLARGQSTSDIAGGSSRFEFWEAGLAFWGRNAELSEQLFGYGFNGHVQSHVVYLYYQSGGFVNSPEALTLHGTLLQQMFDAGYVGLATLVAGLFLVGRRYTRAGNLPASVLVGVLLATSAIEIYLVPAFRTTSFCLLLALAATPAMSARTSSAQDAHARA